MFVTAKVNEQGQIIIPQIVRDALNVVPGDIIEWKISQNHQMVTVNRLENFSAEESGIENLDIEYLRSLESTLSEWNSSEDEVAYRDL